MLAVADLVPDPTTLPIIDEVGKRLARYPQFYSRIGFVHEFRVLSPSEMQQLIDPSRNFACG